MVFTNFMHMKYLAILCLLFLFAYSASAQKPVPATKEVLKNIGHDVTVLDSVKGYKVISKDTTLLYLGGKYPNQLVTVIIKGKEIKLKPTAMMNKWIYVTGPLTLDNGKPQIVVSESYLISIYPEFP